MKKLIRKKRGYTLLETLTAASLASISLVGGVAAYMAGMMSWMKGVGAMDSMTESQNSARYMAQQLREAISVSVSPDGNSVTYTLPLKDSSGSYVLPLTSDTTNRSFNLSNGTLTQTVGTSTQTLTANVLSIDPSTNSSYSLFSANSGTITRQLMITLVTSKQGYRNNWTPSRSRESVNLRNVPQLER